MVLKELSKVAFGDPRRVMVWGKEGVKLLESSELTDDEAAMVASVSETVTTNGGTVRLQTNDKLRALELIGKHLGMFPTKVEGKHEVTGKDGGPIEHGRSAKDMSDEELAEALKKYGIDPEPIHKPALEHA
jgi:hypothetical protein